MKKFIIPPASLAIFLAGCTTAKITDYQPPAASVSERTAEASGVDVALDPFVEKARTEKYFDMDAVGNGVAILHVRVTNKTADQTFLVEKKNFQLVPDGASTGMAENSSQLEASKGKNMETTAVVLYGVGSEVVGVGFLLAGAAAQSHSSEIQRNFVAKEMADQTLSPGQSMEGFVYFSPVKKGEDWSRTMTAKVDLPQTRTSQVTELSIPLSH